MFSRRVDSEIVVRYERAGCDQSHHADEGFRQHSAVANRQDGAFVHEHLRRRAGRNHAVEAGNSTAGDGDEDIRQDRAGDDRAAASAELGDSRHLDCRADDDDADGQGADGTNLHVCRKIITGSQEQPYRKGGSYEAVNDEAMEMPLALIVNSGASVGEAWTAGPRTTASKVRATPMMVPSLMRPGRRNCM